MPRISNTWYDFFLFNTVSMFMSGALSLTAITLNRLVGIMMPKLANILELNRSIVYCILGVIWLISFGAAIPTFDYRRYDVRYMFWACLNTKWDLYNVLICFRPHISRITHYSFVQRVSFVKSLNKILYECIPILNVMCFRAQDSWWQRFELSILQLLVHSMYHNHMDSYHIYDSCLQYDLIQASSISQSFSILISAIHNCQVKTKSYPNAFFIDHNWIDMLGPLAIFYTLWIHLSTYLWPKWFRKRWSFSWCKIIA